jgi:hypothetical protein
MKPKPKNINEPHYSATNKRSELSLDRFLFEKSLALYCGFELNCAMQKIDMGTVIWYNFDT